MLRCVRRQVQLKWPEIKASPPSTSKSELLAAVDLELLGQALKRRFVRWRGLAFALNVSRK